MPMLLTGDAETVLATLPSSSVHCCVTSPPYFRLRSYLPDDHPDKPNEIGLEPTPKDYIANLIGVLREVKRVLRDDATMWLNLGDTYSNSGRGGHGSKQATNIGSKLPALRTDIPGKNLLGIPWRVAIALQDDGWILRSAIVWAKNNPFPESVRDRPTSSYEHVFLFAKSEQYYYDADAIKEPATGLPSGRPSKAKMDARHAIIKGGGEGGFRNGYPGVQFRNARNVWHINVKPTRNIHYATMPLELASRCITAGSKVGDLVLDPFGGAGTTGVAAKSLGRDYTLIDLNPAYTKLAEDRLGLSEVRLP